jgi:hypothetical protein
MIRHIVMWKLKDSAEGASKKENAEKLKTLLLSLQDKISVLRKIQVGINLESLPYKNDDVVLITDFDNAANLATYQEHPEHKKVAEFVMKIRESRMCVDYEY